MNLADAEVLANLYLESHNLAAKGWQFKFDNAKTRMGLCTYSTKTISLSSLLCLKASEAEVENTILHEIAHALVHLKFKGTVYARRVKAHGREWRSQAIAIGCDGKRCHNVAVVGNYKGTCSVCGHEDIKARKPMQGRVYCCSNCYRLNRKYVAVDYVKL